MEEKLQQIAASINFIVSSIDRIEKAVDTTKNRVASLASISIAAWLILILTAISVWHHW